MYAPHAFRLPQSPEETVGFPRTRVTAGCEIVFSYNYFEAIAGNQYIMDCKIISRVHSTEGNMPILFSLPNWVTIMPK